MPILATTHVPMVSNDLADVLRWHVFLLRIHKAKLALFSIPLGLQLLPFSCYKRNGHNYNLHCTCFQLSGHNNRAVEEHTFEQLPLMLQHKVDAKVGFARQMPPPGKQAQCRTQGAFHSPSLQELVQVVLPICFGSASVALLHGAVRSRKCSLSSRNFCTAGLSVLMSCCNEAADNATRKVSVLPTQTAPLIGNNGTHVHLALERVPRQAEKALEIEFKVGIPVFLRVLLAYAPALQLRTVIQCYTAHFSCRSARKEPASRSVAAANLTKVVIPNTITAHAGQHQQQKVRTICTTSAFVSGKPWCHTTAALLTWHCTGLELHSGTANSAGESNRPTINI